jgi:hypothetical protein
MAAEWLVTGLIVLAGLSNKQIHLSRERESLLLHWVQ